MGFLLKHTHCVYWGDEMANNQSLVCYLHTLQGFFPSFFKIFFFPRSLSFQIFEDVFILNDAENF